VRERAPGARVLVIKPALFGSWDFTQTVAAAAVQDGLRVVFGGAYESGVGVRAGLAIAALAAPDEAVGFDSYNRLERDLLRPPLELDRPTIDLRDAFRLDREVTSEMLIPVSRNA
jgi:O-succinylbenzoate synthase